MIYYSIKIRFEARVKGTQLEQCYNYYCNNITSVLKPNLQYFVCRAVRFRGTAVIFRGVAGSESANVGVCDHDVLYEIAIPTRIRALPVI